MDLALTCPACERVLAPLDMICVGCGRDLRNGRRLRMASAEAVGRTPRAAPEVWIVLSLLGGNWLVVAVTLFLGWGNLLSPVALLSGGLLIYGLRHRQDWAWWWGVLACTGVGILDLWLGLNAEYLPGELRRLAPWAWLDLAANVSIVSLLVSAHLRGAYEGE